LTTVHFTCSACGQTIEVNDAMRDTILETGCPVCTTGASESDFSADPDEA
jgi:predicted nucleic acid-binding Zn ribbon protein